MTSTEVLKYRWIILLLFSLNGTINFMQKFFSDNKTRIQIDGGICRIIAVVVCIPLIYFIGKYNLRWITIMSSGLTALGTVLKYFSILPARYVLMATAQILCGIAQSLVLSVLTEVISTWFGPKEVSGAAAIAVLGTQLGTAIGLVWPSSILRNTKHVDEKLQEMAIIDMSLAWIICIAVIFCFKEKPPLPPSKSQITILETERSALIEDLKKIVKNKSYLLLNVSFGISIGIWFCFNMLFDDIYLHYFPHSKFELTAVACIANIAGGCFGSVVCGYILDTWHIFKTTTFFSIFCAAVSFVFVLVSLEERSSWGTYFAVTLFGFFIGSNLLTSLEFVTEVTYPVSPAYSCAILNAVISLFTIIFNIVFVNLFNSLGFLDTFVFMTALLMISSLLIYFVSSDLNRRQANLEETDSNRNGY